MTRIIKRYSQEQKEKMIKRMLPPENCSASNLSIETGISKLTLATWKTKALKGEVSRKHGRPKNGLSSQEKFVIVMETYTLSEIELSKYCREKGFYVEDIKKWRLSCFEANKAAQGKNSNNSNLKEKLIEEKTNLKNYKKI